MRPFFPYYGSKWRAAKRYPAPEHPLVIEPFAGSAAYATYYEPERVLLFDRDPIIVGVWQYLIGVPRAELLALPDLAVGQSVDEFPHLPQEARWLIGFWLNRGSAQPKKTMTAFAGRTAESQLTWGAKARERIAAQLDRVRKWQIFEKSFDTAPGIEATWFVDPPYEQKGRHYRFSAVDYPQLAAWCRSRHGLVVVCEQHGARWAPFQPLAVVKSTRGTSAEAIWISRSADSRIEP